jgi:hypothetical protein
MDITQDKIKREDNIFTNLFGFKLLNPKINKDELGYNPLKNYTKKQFAVETLQNEHGEQNNLSKVMDEYEAARDEFMAQFLNDEAFMADEPEESNRLADKSKKLGERSKFIKINSAFKNETDKDIKPKYYSAEPKGDERYSLDDFGEVERSDLDELHEKIAYFTYDPASVYHFFYDADEEKISGPAFTDINKMLKSEGIEPIPRSTTRENLHGVVIRKLKEFLEKYNERTAPSRRIEREDEEEREKFFREEREENMNKAKTKLRELHNKGKSIDLIKKFLRSIKSLPPSTTTHTRKAPYDEVLLAARSLHPSYERESISTPSRPPPPPPRESTPSRPPPPPPRESTPPRSSSLPKAPPLPRRGPPLPSIEEFEKGLTIKPKTSTQTKEKKVVYQ